MILRLSETQKLIVEHDEGPLLVVAGPGSGKTRVLTERIRRLLTKKNEHFRILALTFTNKAANEMKERLSDLKGIEKRSFIGTLHSFCMEVLSNRGKAVGVEKLPNIFESYQDRKQVLLQAAIDDPDLHSILLKYSDKNLREKLLNKWLDMIASAKNQFILPEMMDDVVGKKVYEAYNDGLRALNVLDFDDLLLLTYRLFQERPKIADFYRRQYSYICIDEAQDLNEAQYQVLCALCGSSHRNVMMVGDPKQAIFVWNGANPKYLDLFERDFGAKKISMNENFRSSQVVVNAAKALIPEYDIDGQPVFIGFIKLIVGDNEQQEAIAVLDYIQKLILSGHEDLEAPIAFERCAFLGRNRYVLAHVEKELKNRQIPYFKQLSAQHESESDLLRDFEVGLRIMVNPLDKLHLNMLLKRWGINSNNIYINNINDPLVVLSEIDKHVSEKDQKAILYALKAMDYTYRDIDFMKSIDYLDIYSKDKIGPERALIKEDIMVWRDHWNSFLHSQPGGQHSLSTFLSQVALGTTQQPKQEGIALLTVHSAKGLEFDVVVVMGMTEGTFPDYRAKGPALQEEKRNMFVAVTRSKRVLVLSYPRTRIMPWGSVRKQKPSRYLKDLGFKENLNEVD
ncbi:MAG: ATP-dependent helicase [Methanothrix soehngenii]|jgi:DNA helicase-2/ATP-dependent DNA helicase PcrA|uniref:ATP-dependent helicase n=1 Tax=Methanothrix soehngenii TaxID=2223 RepID=UPI0031435357